MIAVIQASTDREAARIDRVLEEAVADLQDLADASPALEAGLFAGLANLILTPHIAGITDEANERTGVVTVANVRAVLEG